MHCKDVAIREVDAELTEEGIAALMRDWTAYRRAEYLVLRNGDGLAVVRLIRPEGGELFSKVESYEIVSLPEDTVYEEIPDADVLNVPTLARVQMMHPGKSVVVKGMFSHVSFVCGMEPLRLRIVDSIPPEPMKLGVLARLALASGYVEKPVVIEELVVDMADRIPEVGTEAVMFPCAVSGLKADRPYYFLDSAPELKHDVTLIGCHLSERIFRTLYGYAPKLLNVCPADHMPDDGVRTLTKCCKVKTGHIIDGHHASVPWGATVPEVVDAINDLFSDQ